MRRTKPLITTILALICALAMCAPAQAEVVQRKLEPQALAESVAFSYWGQEACGGHDPIVYTAAVPSVPLEANAGPANAAVEDGEQVIQAWAAYGDPTCTIHLNPAIWDEGMEYASFQYFCDVITHEIGHFFGHLDEGQTNEASIQYPTIDPASPNFDSVPGCATTKAVVEEWVTTPAEVATEAGILRELSEEGQRAHRKGHKPSRRGKESRRQRRGQAHQAGRRHKRFAS
jgi:hypothetical protein